MLEEKRISKQSLDELFDDMKIALGLLGREAKFRRMSQSPKSKYYFVHVLWKVSDLNPLLHQLVHTCKNLLTGIADFENFVEEVAFALEWSINNCANTRNASIARDKLKKHLNSFLSVNENQNDVGDKQSFRTPSVAYPADWSDESSRYDFVEKMRNGKCEVEKMYQTVRNFHAFMHVAITLCHINCRYYQFHLYFRLKLTLTHQISMKKSGLGDHDSLVLDKVASTTCSMGIPSQKNLIKRSSLRNHMLAEDDVKNERK
ncbi:hypothetical protein RYX36_027738 [Vicia faba]